MTSLLLGALLVLQLAASLAYAKSPTPPQAVDAATRLAALQHAVGHAVETCHHQDEDGQPAGEAGPCCPLCCHALSATCPAAPVSFAVAQPVATIGVAIYPQPPPRLATVFLAFAGPRGPPLLG